MTRQLRKTAFKLFSQFGWSPILLTLVGLLTIAAVASRPLEREYINSGDFVEATPECAQGQSSPEILQLSLSNSNILKAAGQIQVILHQSEGCLRKAQELKFTGIKRDSKDARVIIKEVAGGTLRIDKIRKIAFPDLPKEKRRYLQRKLDKNTRSLVQRPFFLLDLQFVNGPIFDDENAEEEIEDLDE